jgi:hypothetical protein
MLFQVKELLKGESEIGVSGSFFMAKTVGSNEICLVPANEARELSKGTKVIMAFNGQLNQDREQEADLSACVVAPLNDQNLAAVRRGIARDKIDDPPQVY